MTATELSQSESERRPRNVYAKGERWERRNGGMEFLRKSRDFRFEFMVKFFSKGYEKV